MRKWFNKQTIIAFLLGILIMIPVGSYAATKIIYSSFTDNGLVINGQRVEGQVAAIKAEGQRWASTYAPLKLVAQALGGDAWIENNDVVIDTRTDLEKVVANCKDSCVMIYAYGQDDKGQWTSQGSGFAYNGYIITANHVIHPTTEANKIIVYPDDSGYGVEAAIVDIQTDLDVAVLKCDLQLPSVKLGDSDKLIEGEKLVSITSPNGTQNAIDECINNGPYNDVSGEFLAISESAIVSGSSGGAVFNYQSEIIGMVKSSAAEFSKLIPINDIKPILQNLK